MNKKETKEVKNKKMRRWLLFSYFINLLLLILVFAFCGMGFLFLKVLNGDSAIYSAFSSMILVAGLGYIFFGVLDSWYKNNCQKLK